MAPTLVWMASDSSTMGTISRGCSTRATRRLVTGSHQPTRSISIVSTPQQRTSNSSISEIKTSDAWARKAWFLTTIWVKTDMQSTSVRRTINKRNNEANQVKGKMRNQHDQSIARLQQSNNQRTSKKRKTTAGVSQSSPVRYFDTSMASRSNTRKKFAQA